MTRQDKLSAFVQTSVGAVLWAIAVGITTLAALAIVDSKLREAQQLDRVHLDGMVTGASLCGSGS